MPRLELLAVLLFVFATSASAQAPDCAAPDIVCTQQGAVKGVIEGEVLSFKGIPYARPPVGASPSSSAGTATCSRAELMATRSGPRTG